jgi:hypothetical protein
MVAGRLKSLIRWLGKLEERWEAALTFELDFKRGLRSRGGGAFKGNGRAYNIII